MKYLFILLFILANCKEEVNRNISIDVYCYSKTFYIGNEKGMLTFESSVNAIDIIDRDDIEQLSNFTLEIKGDQTNNNYTLSCRLWIGYKNRVIILCNFNENLKTNESIDSKLFTKTVVYKTYNIDLQMSIERAKFIKVDFSVPFLYSAIDINVDANSAKINFGLNIDSYNNERLLISNSKYKAINLDKCKRESNLLNCEIPKANFDLIANETNQCGICYFLENGEIIAFDYAIVNINYIGYTKEDIYVKVETIQETKVDKNSFITASTNITNLPLLKSGDFRLNMTSETRTKCYFIKHDNSTPLYLTCYVPDAYEGTIGEIQEISLNYIHYKYNFIIAPGRLDEKINITNIESSYIIHSYPDTLDFTKEDSPIEVYLSLNDEGSFENISLNVEKGDLECEDLIKSKKCKVPKSHFDGKKGGFYFIHHLDSNNKYVANYETFGVKVVLPGDNVDPENSGKIGKYSLELFALLCFLVI